MTQISLSRLQGGYLIAISGVFLFSLKPIFVKLAYRYGVDTTTLMTLRMGFSLPVYILVASFTIAKQRQDLTTIFRSTPKILAIGVIGYYGASYLDLKALEHISAQFERLVLFSYPTLVVLLGFLFFANSVKKGTIPSLILTYSGIATLFWHDLSVIGFANLYGGALVFCSACLFALYILFSKQLINQVGSLIFTSIAMCSASLAILVHFNITHELDDLIQPMSVYYIALAIAILSTILPSFLISEAINRIGPNATSIIGSSGTVFTAFLAITILGEQFTRYHLIALVLVVSGMLWMGKNTRE